MTESDELAAALDAAALRWPGLSRPQLLVQLALAGDVVAEETRARRRRRIARSKGALTGVYGPGYLDELRADWPE